MNTRNISFIIFSAAVILIFLGPLRELLLSSFNNELYSHIIIIPFISAYFLFEKRKELSQGPANYWLPGLALITAGAACYLVGKFQAVGLIRNDYLSLMTFAAFVCWLGGVLFFYGLKTFRVAMYPLLFLILIVPVPQFMMDGLIYYLRIWSAEVTYAFFKVAGIPVIRDGFVFDLPGLSVEIAPECSGIRSTLALYITGLLACDLFLKTWRSRGILLLFLFPLSIFKNGLRIVTLSLLGIYVDRSWVADSPLHHKGGIIFFLAALAAMGGIIWLLRKWESRQNKKNA